MNEYTIVHLATHASLVPEVGNSFIVFGDGTATSLTDIEKWTLDAVDLIVLSACETGLGGKFGKNGEEVLGLGYQFTKKDKAKAAIASLWSVNDGGTQVLMDAFYANLQAGKTKAEALRQAQITLVTGKAEASSSNRSATLVARWQGQLPSKVINQLNHPYYWAPFILIGNGL
jgi:CHAT domain-containing protein